MIESGTWTVLFTDIVGSTELRTQLGDDEADVLFGAVDRAVAAAVDKHQGVLVKGLGDGHMAAFRGAADGIAAAVAIQQAAVRERTRRARESDSAPAMREPKATTCSAHRSSRRHGCAMRPRAARSWSPRS